MTQAAVRNSAVAEALREYLLAVGDDELILGHRHSEWTGFGPDIESDVALSSIAQEEMGHARLFYLQALALAGRPDEHLDAAVFDRAPEAFRHAVLLERPNGDWGFTIVRFVLYELADAVRLDVLSHGAGETLAPLARTLQREEKYHRMYGETWLARLSGGADGRARVQDALDATWPEALGLFAPTAGEAHLLEAGLLVESSAGQLSRWRERASEILTASHLRVPTAMPAGEGRHGAHSPDLTALLEEMTQVRRLDPEATW